MNAALGAMVNFVPLLAVAGVPLAVDVIDRSARAQEVPPEFVRVTDLWLEATTILGRYAHMAGGSGVLLGVVLFVAAGLFVRGSEWGRRATRVLLVVHAVHWIAATAWAVSIVMGPWADWSARHAKALSDLQEAWPGTQERFPVAMMGSEWPSAVSCVVVGLFGLGVDALLYWAAGTRTARDWCAARGAPRDVATPDAAGAS